ncbi:hypothetical protein F2P44_18330 [Massilia sp. CCM 8695]|uniref:SGNH/GDSL hydrolase family protein n=1 Tax=Massilia frigida TaxID=2609281 RepID=A0ABX0NFB6_9BURK|nr:hypothetical protein [Massilia frigida]NHZ81217.1 hypothetical protein [Massilia frigida]
MKAILVIGHSHINALRAVPEAQQACDFMSFTEAGGAYQQRDPAEFKALAAGPADTLVFMMGGNTHITLGMLNPPEPFDFYLPEHTGLPMNPAARLLPVDLVRLLLTRHLKPDLAYLGQLSAVFKGRRQLHIESPPPLPSEYIEQHPSGFAERVRERGVAPVAFRHKFWLLHSAILRDHCTALGITFVARPAGTQDADGCLATPYLRADPTHANEAYGALLLAQILSLREGAPSP